jgi:HD-like signal output (HDOD) protein
MPTTDITRAGLLSLWQKAIRRDPDLHEVAGQLSTLPDLAAATLRFANSAYMGATYPVGSVLQSVVRVGCRAVGSLAAARLGRSLTEGLGNDDSWNRALITGRGAKVIGRMVGLPYQDTEELFVAGLFAEVGYLVSAADDGRYRQWMEEARPRILDDADLLAQERAVFGVSHVERASAVLDEWNLPPRLGLAIAGHHSPATDFERVLAAAMTLPESIPCIQGSWEVALEALGLDGHEAFIRREATIFATTTAAAFG